MFNKTSIQATFFVQPGLLPVLAIRMSTDLKHRSKPSFIFHIFQPSFLTCTKQQKIVCSRCFWTSGNTPCYLGEVAALRGCTGGNTGDALFVEVNAVTYTLHIRQSDITDFVLGRWQVNTVLNTCIPTFISRSVIFRVSWGPLVATKILLQKGRRNNRNSA